jgi:hypothetical protein
VRCLGQVEQRAVEVEEQADRVVLREGLPDRLDPGTGAIGRQ